MAKEAAIGKRATISQAEQYILLAIIGAAMFLGAAISLVVYFSGKISYNSNVIAEEEKSIVAYSNTISKIGICPSPKDKNGIYTEAEIKACNPNDVDVSSVPGTLRSKIIEDLAANPALNSVQAVFASDIDEQLCMNKTTGNRYTYNELIAIYKTAETEEERQKATESIQNCSALRNIPDALPSIKNEEALLASLDKIFRDSDWEPESLAPTGESSVSSINGNLNAINLRLAIEADSSVVMRVLNNAERSIREFNIERATIEWSGENVLTFNAQATAFYMEPSVLGETDKSIKPGDKPSTSTSSSSSTIDDEEEEE